MESTNHYEATNFITKRQSRVRTSWNNYGAYVLNLHESARLQRYSVDLRGVLKVKSHLRTSFATNAYSKLQYTDHRAKERTPERSCTGSDIGSRVSAVTEYLIRSSLVTQHHGLRSGAYPTKLLSVFPLWLNNPFGKVYKAVSLFHCVLATRLCPFQIHSNKP